jgi:hypothetical protein
MKDRNVRIVLVSMLIVAAALLVACGEEEVVGGICDLCPTFQPLTARENVVNNLELSYNKRNFAEFDELLDSDFTFYFGGTIPAQWGRADETAVTMMLFDRDLNVPGVPVCRSIRVGLSLENGVQWVELPSPQVLGEVWYTTTVYYEFTFEMAPDLTYIAVPGSQAQFTVRNAGTDDAPQWRLVEWRDLADNTATNATTWGGVKSLYRAVD